MAWFVHLGITPVRVSHNDMRGAWAHEKTHKQEVDGVIRRTCSVSMQRSRTAGSAMWWGSSFGKIISAPYSMVGGGCLSTICDNKAG